MEWGYTAHTDFRLLGVSGPDFLSACHSSEESGFPLLGAGYSSPDLSISPTILPDSPTIFVFWPILAKSESRPLHLATKIAHMSPLGG